MTNMTQDQTNVVDVVENGKGSVNVIAVAGSGKTYTIVQAAKKIPGGTKVQMLAFNKSIQTVLNQKTPDHVWVSTFHSAGFGAVRRDIGKDKASVVGDKVSNLLKEKLDKKYFKSYGPTSSRLISLAKNAGFGTHVMKDDGENWRDLMDHHDIMLPGHEPFENDDDLIRISRDVLKKSNQLSKSGVVDYDDMIYLPVLWDLHMFYNAFVFVDEAQDTNVVRRVLIEKMAGTQGRVIAVGDPNQAIYGFTGASHDSMDQISKAFDSKEMPLSVCFRCPQSVVALAKEIVPQIEHAEGAEKGLVKYHNKRDISMYENTDIILCRNVQPMIEEALAIIASGRGCRIMGRDIAAGMVALVGRMKTDKISVMLKKLTEWMNKEVQKLKEREREDRIPAIQDKVDAVRAVVDSCESDEVSELTRRIESMFGDSDSTEQITLSTVHKAKGGEWDRVFILRPDLMPSKSARKPWQLTQEYNLMYVAYTRAMKELHFLPSEER